MATKMVKDRTQAIHNIVDALRSNAPVSSKQYKFLYKNCNNVAKRIFNQYKLNELVYKPNYREELLEDITTMSLMKALKGYDRTKAGFMTHYYNKVRSYTRVQAGKTQRRYKLINTSELPTQEERLVKYGSKNTYNHDID